MNIASGSLAKEALNLLPDLLFGFSEDGTITAWNDAVPEVTGYSEHALAEMTAADFFDAQDADHVITAITNLFEAGTATVEAELVTATGERIPYEFTARRAPDDSPLHVVGLGRDITGRRTPTQGRNDVIDRMGDGFFAVDTDWRVTYANQQGKQLLARAMDRPLHETAFEGLDLWEEIPGAADTRFYEEYHHAMATGETTSFVEHFEPLEEWFDVRVFPDDTGLSVHFRNITEQREQRQQLERREQVLRDLHTITADRDAEFIEQVQQLLVLGRTEFDTEYASLSKISGDDYLFQVVAADDDSIQAGDVVPLEATNCEIVASRTETIAYGNIAEDAPEQTHRAGYTDWGISCYLGAPVYDNDGVYGTFCFYGTDTRADQFSDWEVTLVDLMSRWVSYELQRKQVTEQLQRQNDRLEQFASIVSHDLRNPVNVMSGRLELAEETGDPEEFARCFDALERMEALIDDLLTLSTAGAAIADVEPVALDDLAEESWSSLSTTTATLRFASPRTVSADRSRLKQLLENLFRNAIEHGGEDVTVTVGGMEDGFYVVDDGPGISDEHRDDIFESGFSTTTDGTGLGLSIVADIVDAHDWEVHVTNGEGGGTRFEITGVDHPDTEFPAGWEKQ